MIENLFENDRNVIKKHAFDLEFDHNNIESKIKCNCYTFKMFYFGMCQHILYYLKYKKWIKIKKIKNKILYISESIQCGGVLMGQSVSHDLIHIFNASQKTKPADTIQP